MSYIEEKLSFTSVDSENQSKAEEQLEFSFTSVDSTNACMADEIDDFCGFDFLKVEVKDEKDSKLEADPRERPPLVYKFKNVAGSNEYPNYSLVAGSGKGVADIVIELLGLRSTNCQGMGIHVPDKDYFDFYRFTGKVTKKTTARAELQLEYEYPTFSGKGLGGAFVDTAQALTIPFKFLIPSRGVLVKKTSLKVDSCLHWGELSFEIYPDIKWKLKLAMNPSANSFWAHDDVWSHGLKKETFVIGGENEYTWPQAEESRKVLKSNRDVTDKWYDSVTTKQGTKAPSQDFKFELALEATWNGSSRTASVGPNWASTISKWLGAFIQAKRTIETLIHLDKHQDSNSSYAGADILARLKRYPITMRVHNPGLGVDIGWGLIQTQGSDGTIPIATQFDGKISLDPLIGGEGVLDLICLAQKFPFPQVAAVLRVLDFASSAVGLNVRLDLKLEGKLVFDFSGKIDTEAYNNSGEGALSGDVRLTLTFSALLTGKVRKIWIGNNIDYNVGGEGMASFAFSAKAALGGDNFRGLYLDVGLGHAGILVEATFVAEIGLFGMKKKVKHEIIPANEHVLGGKYYLTNSDG